MWLCIPRKGGDERNHHAHIMLTTRSIGADGFEGKDRSWNSKELLEEWRESWADHANAYLREIEVGREIDHRSLEAQREEAGPQGTGAERGDTKTAHELEIEAVELDRDPLPDIGWKAWGMERRGIRPPQAIYGVRPVAGWNRSAKSCPVCASVLQRPMPVCGRWPSFP